MAQLSADDILKLARLARLDLTEEEVELYRHELTEILQYVELLNEVDAEGHVPTNQVTGLTNVFRADEIIDYGYAPADLLTNVPRVRDDQIEVKRMIG